MFNLENNDKELRPNIQPGVFKGSIDHRGIDEVLHMNKFQFLLTIERLQKQKPKFPHFEHVLIPFTLFLAFLLPLFTADFKNALGISADVWHSFTLNFAVLFFIIALVLFIWWIINCGRYPDKSAEDILEEVITGMELERKKFEEADKQRKSANDTAKT